MKDSLHTGEELAQIFKRAPAGTKFILRIRNDSPVADNSEEYYRIAFCNYLHVSRKDAVRLAERSLSKGLEKKGARIRLSIDNENYWFGA